MITENINLNDEYFEDNKSYKLFCFKSLKHFKIPNNITHIQSIDLAFCNSLTEIVIPENIKIIGRISIFECNSLKKIIIPDSVVNIGTICLSYCKCLEKIAISNNVSSNCIINITECDNVEQVCYDEKLLNENYDLPKQTKFVDILQISFILIFCFALFIGIIKLIQKNILLW